MSSHIDDPSDEPPPYTPRADPLQGESTVEYGPTRPFQRSPAVSRPAPIPGSAQQPELLSSQTSSISRRGRSLWQQLTDQIDQLADELENRGNRANSNTQRMGAPWSSYPGRSLPNASTLPPRRNVPAPPPPPPPPPPPRRRTSSMSSVPQTSSEFARDFYAAGTGDGLFSDTGTSSRVWGEAPRREDRSLTTTPTPGRPLLRDGKLLVYPGGHTCEKCLNTGYKHFDPDRPCKKCWAKYGKPFTGPLAYSYSSSGTVSNTQNTRLQKPLPGGSSLRPAVPARPATSNGWHVVANEGGRRYGAPPPETVIYSAGDARIGGSLCWRCHGKGTMNILIDVINCPICNGCGRTFGSVY